MEGKLISPQTRLVGGMGSRYADSTGSPAAITGLQNFMLVVREDTTITSITGEDAEGNTIDVLSQMGLSVATTLTKGEKLYADLNTVITGIEVASGSVILH